jgi:hypothetical protein
MKMTKELYKGDLLERFDGKLYQVVDILFEHDGIFKMLVIDENDVKSISYTYFFKGWEVNN